MTFEDLVRARLAVTRNEVEVEEILMCLWYRDEPDWKAAWEVIRKWRCTQ